MTPLIPASTFVWKTISVNASFVAPKEFLHELKHFAFNGIFFSQVSQENGGTSLAQSLELQSTFARRNKIRHL